MQTYENVLCEEKHNILKNIPDLNHYIGRGEKMFFGDAQEYIRELRNCEREHEHENIS